MTKAQRELAYRDWYQVYVEEVVNRVKHWGDKHKQSSKYDGKRGGLLDPSLFEPGR